MTAVSPDVIRPAIPADVRRSKAKIVRERAAISAERLAIETERAGNSFSNGEELDDELMLIANFTKGLAHNDDGTLLNRADYDAFVRVIVNNGLPADIAQLPLGPPTPIVWRSPFTNQANNGQPAEVRGWESMTAGNAYSLIGPDAQGVRMPPAPLLASDEVIAEMGELYAMALARDIPIANYESDPTIAALLAELNQLAWFANPTQQRPTPEENARRRGLFTPSTLFRGILPGSEKGPYLSQFLVAGSSQFGNNGDAGDGFVRYGAQVIDQRVRIARANRDFMTDKPAFLDVQDAADVRGTDEFDPGLRNITTLRDLATYVHFDALYQAYLSACLVLLADGFPVDPNLPFREPDSIDRQEGFALYGGPHILSLVTEVATRALKAVRYQKFNVHRRLRPEALGGFLNEHLRFGTFPQVSTIASALGPFLDLTRTHNAAQNAVDPLRENADSYLLPMAFPEGSPNHPSYGSGHATVAGACVTILKAFFDESTPLTRTYEVDASGELRQVTLPDGVVLTVGSELNKLADNISVGRDAAGVHWFSDQFESLLLGEQVAIELLKETQLTLFEEFSFTFTSFDGTPQVIRRTEALP